jgi:hypothetical protein
MIARPLRFPKAPDAKRDGDAWSTAQERANASAVCQYWYSQGNDGIGEHVSRERMTARAVIDATNEVDLCQSIGTKFAVNAPISASHGPVISDLRVTVGTLTFRRGPARCEPDRSALNQATAGFLPFLQRRPRQCAAQSIPHVG